VALTKDGLLACRLCEVKEITVAGLPDTIYIRKLPAGALFEIASLAKKHESNGDQTSVMIRTLELAITDKDGERLFGDGEGVALADLDVSVLPALALEIQAFSGLTAEAEEEAGKESGSRDGGSSP